MEKEFITYGHFLTKDKFNQLQKENKYYWRNKPHGGVWASPVNSECGWKEWCTGEMYNVESLKTYTKWELQDPSKILIIDSFEDLLKIYQKYPLESMKLKVISNQVYLDFCKMQEDGWDGIFLTNKGQWETREYTLIPEGKILTLYGWDCESIVVWNWNQIKILEKGRL